MPDTEPTTTTPTTKTTDLPAAYATAPHLHEEREELIRTMKQLPPRERLVRQAALADRSTSPAHETDSKAAQHLRTTARKLAAHDAKHGTATNPNPPLPVTADSPLGPLRAYIRQEYAAWLARSQAV